VVDWATGAGGLVPWWAGSGAEVMKCRSYHARNTDLRFLGCSVQFHVETEAEAEHQTTQK
jgi:hypothetical protein